MKRVRKGRVEGKEQFEKAKAGQMKEEISLELAELGNMTPKQEPMTPNDREKSERERWYNGK